MVENDKDANTMDNLMEAWFKGAADFWSMMAQAMPRPNDAVKETSPHQVDFADRSQGAWRFAAKTMQVFFSLFSDSQSMASLSSGATLMPDMGRKLSFAWLEGYFNLQRQWLQKMAGLASRGSRYSFDEVDLQQFKDWQELYEKEFQRFFKIPPLGLTRFYQERSSLLMDRLNILQLKMTEFLFLLYLPMEKAQRKMQEQLEQDYEEGMVSEDFSKYYQSWLKVLEGHYMNLFKSPDYIECLNQALAALSDFMQARRDILQDIIKTMPVPTEQDMDEVYKELYQLKKQVKQIKKAAEQQ